MQMVTHSSVDSCPRVTRKGDTIIVEKITAKMTARVVIVYA